MSSKCFLLLSFFLRLADEERIFAQCFGNKASAIMHCSSQIVVMIFFASFAISSRNMFTTDRERSRM
uniref:Secreted protein n=1 Tax=Anopheles darlingi TaxID=43151 RepID=A0A2M4DF68_ANODA